MLCRWKLYSKQRRLTLSKLIILFFLLIVVIQITHIILLSKIRGNTKTAKKNEVSEMIKKIYESYKLDSSGSYHMIADVALCSHYSLSTSKPTRERYDVTVVTQTSLNNIQYIVKLANQWEGPISVTIFAFDNYIVTALLTIAALRKCNPIVLEMVSFHLVYPLQRYPRNLHNSYESSIVSCEDLPNILASNIPNYSFDNIQYPHNVLRNFAIKNSRTEFIFMIDIDMLPSAGLRNNFSEFIKVADTFLPNLTAFVVPSFESNLNVSVPIDKKDLLKKWDNLQVRPFYFEVCWKCQQHTDYETWREIDGSYMKVAYNIPWKDPWEPFFITRHFVPAYDERFKQYGFNRISNVCELHIAGYTFNVLSNAFIVHQGLKTSTNFHNNKIKELNQNRLLFRKFKEELKTKYPYSTKRCY
ncbi:beta-1,4-glucuronyltransferase 1-like [Octopus sinensis]|uniref:Beta-1,4-glucuronyltransferase 1 n=1 Tax=Octopus sinensis TaxID=2607531 RepID=A0A6P7SSE1_9MOLL|nr:beta-1,4-glucuronyltransferase 1-like [Octopus sinensis]XP_036362055.1 beta-1,4-glucuronyltransferase 1-like [Octopus sinensis]XP_036362056.1 beta-1,4-glucuronyltransferase 1-like [Octopus sinensis]XP_036362057.1 beta-1,4-glucuronyltransferase 1-like [Octopus sinensis]